MKLELERLDAAFTILQSAVQRGTPGTYVYVVTAEKNASLRKVQLGPLIGDRVVIAAGLKEGESIVIDGADKLRPRPHRAARVVIVQKRTALHRATVKHPQRQAPRPLPRLLQLRQARPARQRRQPRKTANQNR